MELLYLYWICLPSRRLPGGLWLLKLTFSACYGALLMETLWASEVRFTNTKYLNLIPTFASQELRAFALYFFLAFQVSLVLQQALSSTSLTRFCT